MARQEIKEVKPSNNNNLGYSHEKTSNDEKKERKLREIRKKKHSWKVGSEKSRKKSSTFDEMKSWNPVST